MFWSGSMDSSSGGKFWQITVNGDTTEVIYGKTGTEGRKSSKVHDSAGDALDYANKTIASKQKKGYA